MSKVVRHLRALLLALPLLVGCAPRVVPTRPPARSAPTQAGEREPRPALADDTISHAEAATILRRTALMRAMAHEHRYFATMELRVIWEDAIGRPEEDALLELIDAYVLRAPATSDRENVDSLLLVALAEAWAERGQLDRIAPHGAKAREGLESMGSGEWTGMLARIEGRAAAAQYAIEDAEHLDSPRTDRLVALALFDARFGDAALAEEAVDETLEAADACPVVVALAERYARDARPDAPRWWAAADAAPAEIDIEDGDAFDACVMALAQARLRQGDRARAAAAFTRVHRRPIRSTCNILERVIDRVDPTLLDGLLLEGARSERADSRVTWYGCPGILGELAARRGDRTLAAHLLARAIRDEDQGGEEGYDYRWSTSVRLGRTDPFGDDGFQRDVFRTLAVARLLDEAPALRLSRRQLEEALDLDGADEGDETDPEGGDDTTEGDPDG